MIKKLTAIILSVCILLTCGICAFATNIDEVEDISEDQAGSVIGSDLYGTIFQSRSDYLYKLFEKIVDLYVKNHLYEFTKEEAMDKFVYDMIADHPELYEMMINTFLGTMDDYSSYHESSSGFLSVRSPRAGYGIIVKDTGDAVVISSVIKGSAAADAGVKVGDRIVKVMGYDVSRVPWTVISLMLNKPYIYISEKTSTGGYADYNPLTEIVVDRGGELVTFNLQKDVVDNEMLSYEYFEDSGIAYIGISSFLGDTLDTDFAKLLNDIADKGIKKLIIDLRDNGGGSLDLVLNMAENFVEKDGVLCYFRTKNSEPSAVISENDKIEFDSISVLINENTASAAELMASILRNKAGAVLIGKPSYGKALGQSVYNLVTGDYITITTYEVLDANGESYNEEGLIPDLAIDNVEMLYEFPALEIFNHVNYKGIEEGVYSEACLALEKRLNIMGYLRDSSVDGIWDDDTHLAVYVFQMAHFSEGNGQLDDSTVTLITNVINGYKDYTYYEDSQLDVAKLYHSSFSQAKRLVAEKERLANKQKELIEANRAKVLAELDEEN